VKQYPKGYTYQVGSHRYLRVLAGLLRSRTDHKTAMVYPTVR